MIRRSEPRDAGAIAEVWWRSRQASIPSIPAPVHPRAEVEEWCRSLVTGPRETWVAVEVDVEVGSGLVTALLVLDGDWVDQLYVDPGYTNRGIGASLLNLAKKLRPGGLQLWTFESNAGARRFYERNGFALAGRTDGDNEEGAPDIRYVWPGSP